MSDEDDLKKKKIQEEDESGDEEMGHCGILGTVAGTGQELQKWDSVAKA